MGAMIPVIVLCAILGLATAGAAMRGGAVEHTGVVVFSLAWMASLVVEMMLPGADAAFPLMLIDLGLLAGLVALAWKSPRPWPVWSSGFQLLGVTVGLAFLIRPDVGLETYRTATAFAGYAAAACLTLGAWIGDRRAPD